VRTNHSFASFDFSRLHHAVDDLQDGVEAESFGMYFLKGLVLVGQMQNR